MKLDIIYQDDELVAINKPHGLLVHRSPIARDVTEFALQTLRDQLSQHVYPVHRLDRKTGGVLLFALENGVHRQMQQQFAEKKVKKTYLALVRGFTEMSGEIDYPLKKENGKMQESFTRYKTIEHFEINVPLGKFSTSRYSLVEVAPETGRMHQIRRHFDHILHPIIGDRPHGCNKQNRMFKERWGMITMLLHAKTLSFCHPTKNTEVNIKAPLNHEFVDALKIVNYASCNI